MQSRRSAQALPEDVARAADLLGRRWVLAIVYASHGGAIRFTEFKRTLAGSPPRVEYRLTDAGRRLRALVRALDHCAGDFCR